MSQCAVGLTVRWCSSNPHNGITHERVRSWFAPTKPTRVIVGNPGYRQRLLYTFEDLR